MDSDVLSFDPPYDIHLLRGQNITLLNLLRVEGTPAAEYATAHATVTYLFTPTFLAPPSNVTAANPDMLMSVDMATGRVQADDGNPATPVPNFLVVARATDSADNTSAETVMRIHIHNHVTQAWLTPPVLTLRPTGGALPETTLSKFTVRVQFDDESVGDVTEMQNINWGPSSNVTSSGRLVIDAGNTPGGPPIEITALLPTDLEGVEARGKIQIAVPWEQGPVIQTDVVPEGGWPGILAPETAPNVLFLCDGHLPEDSGKFETQVNAFVHLLKKNKITRPFDRLATSINFFKAFIPSPGQGISTLCEVYTKLDEKAVLRAIPVPDPVRPPAQGRWSIGHLIYRVGLPLRSDVNVPVATLKTRWPGQVGPLPFDMIPDKLIEYWRELGERCFLEEVDSMFGLAYGDRPSAGQPSQTKIVGFHPYRIKRFSMDPMLRKLKDIEHGMDLSDIWNERDDGTKPDSYRLVFIFTPTFWDRGVNRGGDAFITMSVGDHGSITAKEVQDKHSFEVDLAGQIPQEISYTREVRGAHELGHSFNLGDEYSEKGTMPATESVDRYSNLQSSADAKSSGDIDGEEIKWRWHRIKKAGVIAFPIEEASPGVFKIRLASGHAQQFQNGDTVLLRFRKYPDPLLKETAVLTSPLEVAQPPELDHIIVRAKEGDAILIDDLLDFLPGSIAYTPVDAPSSVRSADYPYAELVAKNIMDHITDRKCALNVDPELDDECPGDTRNEEQPVALDVSLPTCFSHKTQIIGLWTGGRTYNCGIYHPAGRCIMRNSSEDGKEFCAVCRYILVDTINPFVHAENDRDYQSIYPLT